MTDTRLPSRSTAAQAIANRCADAYSASAYRSWESVARALLKDGWTAQEAECIMRSKITRWARDDSEKDYPHGRYPASVVTQFITKNPVSRQEVARWMTQ